MALKRFQLKFFFQGSMSPGPYKLAHSALDTRLRFDNDSHVKTGLHLFKNLATPLKTIKHSKGKP